MPGTDLGSVNTKSERRGSHLKELVAKWGIKMTQFTYRKEMVSRGGLSMLLGCN